MAQVAPEEDYQAGGPVLRYFLKPVCLLTFTWSSTAVAQDLPVDIPDGLTSASSIASAAQSLHKAAMDKLLVKDLIGKTLTGTDGNTVGTIENFAVVPGGRIIAALVSTGDGTLIAVPYAAIKIANAAGTASLNVPVRASKLQGMSELRSLASMIAN